MLILLVRDGQMCNQLMTLSAVYALGLEYQEKVFCPVTGKTLFPFYPGLSDADDQFAFTYSKFWESLRKVHKLKQKIFHGQDRKEIIAPNGKRRLVIYNWLDVMNDDVFMKHEAQVRERFRFSDEIIEVCTKRMAPYITENICNVGVHIRRGDYKEFFNGKWYYSDEQYRDWMKELAEKTDCEVRFVLFSNEDLNLKLYQDAGLNVVHLAGSGVEDLCCLSMCDYVLGAPSTYSWWAAMIGNKPRQILKDKDWHCSWEEFKVLDERICTNDNEF